MSRPHRIVADTSWGLAPGYVRNGVSVPLHARSRGVSVSVRGLSSQGGLYVGDRWGQVGLRRAHGSFLLPVVT